MKRKYKIILLAIFIMSTVIATYGITQKTYEIGEFGRLEVDYGHDLDRATSYHISIDGITDDDLNRFETESNKLIAEKTPQKTGFDSSALSREDSGDPIIASTLGNASFVLEDGSEEPEPGFDPYFEKTKDKGYIVQTYKIRFTVYVDTDMRLSSELDSDHSLEFGDADYIGGLRRIPELATQHIVMNMKMSCFLVGEGVDEETHFSILGLRTIDNDIDSYSQIVDAEDTDNVFTFKTAEDILSSMTYWFEGKAPQSESMVGFRKISSIDSVEGSESVNFAFSFDLAPTAGYNLEKGWTLYDVRVPIRLETELKLVKNEYSEAKFDNLGALVVDLLPSEVTWATWQQNYIAVLVYVLFMGAVFTTSFIYLRRRKETWDE